MAWLAVAGAVVTSVKGEAILKEDQNNTTRINSSGVNDEISFE